MNKYYYQIKAKAAEGEQAGFFGGESNWLFPPVFSGMVEADDKKSAKAVIEEEYGRVFPLRVLKKDLEKNEYLLNITEMNAHHERLFEVKSCEHCGASFRVIDKYNDYNASDTSHTYCTSDCSQKAWEVKRVFNTVDLNTNGCSNPVIYKITNKRTGMSYIGKTTQVFTLRWYQHFFQSGNNKFHTEIKESKVTDWSFEVIEIIEKPDWAKTIDEVNLFIIERERHYITLYDSIENGYNSKI